MPAGCADLVGDGLPQNARLDSGAVRLQRKLYQASVGRCVLAKGNDTLNVSRPGGGGHPLILRVVAIKDDGTARFDTGKNLRFRVADLLQRTKVLKMHRLNTRDDADVRTYELRQRRDLAGMVHANLKDGILRTRRTPRERKRNAPMIIVGR